MLKRRAWSSCPRPAPTTTAAGADRADSASSASTRTRRPAGAANPRRRRQGAQLPAPDLHEGCGVAVPGAAGGPVLLRDHPAQGRPGLRRRKLPRAVREHRAASRRRKGGSRARCWSDCVVRDLPPEAPHPAPRRRGGRCATRSASPAKASRGRTPSATTCGRRRRSGWRRWGTDGRCRWTLAERPLAKRHYRTQEMKRPGRPAGGRADAAAVQRGPHAPMLYPDRAGPGLLLQRRRGRAVLHPQGRRDAAHARWATCASSGRLRPHPPRAAPPASSPTPGPQHWLSMELGRAAPPQAVAQRGRPAADGRAVLPPRLRRPEFKGPRTRACANCW